MSVQILMAFILFAAVGSFTPGPNNVMLMTSGVNFGFRRTIPHILGVGFGFMFLITVMGLGLGLVFEAFPVLQKILKILGAAYLVWLAIAIARESPADKTEPEHGHPMTFIGAALFQWVNAKAWVYAVSSVTAYGSVAPFPYNAAILAAVAVVTGLASAATWALFGSGLRHLLSTPRSVRIFNVAMALVLVASLIPVFWLG